MAKYCIIQSTNSYIINFFQRTASSGSFGSFDSNSMSFKSANSGNLMDVASEPEQSNGGAHQDKLSEVHTLPRSSVSGHSAYFAPVTVTSPASSIDLFQLPAASSVPSGDIFQQSSVSSVPSMNLHQATQASGPSLDLFQQSSVSSGPTMNLHQDTQTSSSLAFDLFADINQQQLTTSLGEKLPELPVPKNEGWATFDMPPSITSIAVSAENHTSAKFPSTDGSPTRKVESFSSIDASMQWPLIRDSNGHAPSLVPNPWDQGLHNVQTSSNATSNQVSFCT